MGVRIRREEEQDYILGGRNGVGKGLETKNTNYLEGKAGQFCYSKKRNRSEF